MTARRPWRRAPLHDRAQVLAARRRLRRPVAATLLFFIMIGLPVIWFSGALAVDFVRVLAAQREASQMADAAALAGAAQFLPNNADAPYQESFQLDEPTARRIAEETIVEAVAAGMGGQLAVDTVTVDITPAGGGAPATVTVTLNYTVSDLLLLMLADDLNEDSEIVDGSITRSAYVCVPDANPELTYQGNCIKPRH